MSNRKIKSFTLIAIGLAFLCLFTNIGKAGDNTWTTTGPYGVRILGLAIDPSNSQVIYAATPDGTVNVYKSVDGGMTWLASSDGIPDGVSAVGFAFDPNNPSTVYVATEQGMYKSINAGETWELKSTIEIDGQIKTISAWSIAISPTDGTLYVGAYSSYMGPPAGIYRSRDGGETWEHLGNGAPTSTVGAIALAPSAPHIIYAGTCFGDQGTFRSMDRGESWQTINSGFGMYPHICSLSD